MPLAVISTMMIVYIGLHIVNGIILRINVKILGMILVIIYKEPSSPHHGCWRGPRLLPFPAGCFRLGARFPLERNCPFWTVVIVIAIVILLTIIIINDNNDIIIIIITLTTLTRGL